MSQALASLLNRRVGGVEKEKDLFELPALPKKVFLSSKFDTCKTCIKEEDLSSDSDEDAREDALDAAGLGDVRDVYQVQLAQICLLKHLHKFRWM